MNIKLYFENAKFIEGISGHNSTDRLFRHEKFDEEWRLKILESALTKVAIVDERIFFNNVTPSENFDFNTSNEFDNYIKNNYTAANQAQIKKMRTYASLKRILVGGEKRYDSYEKLKEISLNDFKNSVNQVEQHSNNINPEILTKKRIYIYNVIVEGKKFYTQYLVDETKENANMEFHFVFVHHGIIEKLRNTTSAFKKFMEMFPLQKKGRYIVHSGRSKPSDLPSGVGFAQFSSVEAALTDSKYSLTELAYDSIEEN